MNNKSINTIHERVQSPPKNPPKNIKNILSKIRLFEIFPKIFAVVIKDDKLRARVFMRYQEFYESDSETFRGQGFKWVDFVKFYKEKTKNDIFTYHEDWSGYNLPCDSIESCIKVIPDINYFDLIMFSIIDTIKEKTGNNNFYLIGIDQTDGEDLSLIYHELAHGLWYSSPNYKNLQSYNINNLNPSTLDSMTRKIKNMGYGENVIDDEIQAYLSTGILPDMARIKDIKKAQVTFKNAFDKFVSKISLKEIPINWGVDLQK